MAEYSWQQSGLDGRFHAFRAEDGYVPKEVHTAYLRISTTLTGKEVCAAQEVEVYVAVCWHVVPVAYMMPSPSEADSALCCMECSAESALVSALVRKRAA